MKTRFSKIGNGRRRCSPGWLELRSDLSFSASRIRLFAQPGFRVHYLLRYNLSLLMDFDQLVTFLEVAKLGSFSRAGQKVFRSQSAVSAQIRQLEQEYGDRLLDRSGKDVTLTPAGRVLFAYAERLLQMRDESLLAVADQGRQSARHARDWRQRGDLPLRAARRFCQILQPVSQRANQHLSQLQLQDSRKTGKRDD